MIKKEISFINAIFPIYFTFAWFYIYVIIVVPSSYLSYLKNIGEYFERMLARISKNDINKKIFIT